MTKDDEVRQFNEDRRGELERRAAVAAVVKRLKAHTPRVSPTWDMSSRAPDHNDVDENLLAHGLALYTAPLDDIWAGLYDPSVYEADTLWADIHDDNKIGGVILAWEQGRPLSPPMFVRYDHLPEAYVADGKHRLTVARYMEAQTVPFLVPATQKDMEWAGGVVRAGSPQWQSQAPAKSRSP